MSAETVSNPHDKLFKEAFSRRDMAVGFFQNYLPAEIASRLDWETLHLESGKFTDEVLRGSESDLLYTVQIDQHPALLYCLFEHQSSPDAWMLLRLLRYILRIRDQFLKQHPDASKLPPILPIVLYQGGDAWTADTSLCSLIDIPDGLATYQPDFRHLLVDLNDITEYIKQAEAINQPRLQEEIMTIAEKLRKEGRQEGRQEELREDIKYVLDERFGECSYAIIEGLSMLDDVTQLRALLRQAVRIESLAAFQQHLTK